MATETAKKLKTTFSEASEEEFEPLRFGEIKVGESFIGFPLPGDNSGHGGFRGTNFLFIKTTEKVKEVKPGMPYSKEVPHGGATKINRNHEHHFPDSMLVIKVE
jgi:hypothetical protein